MFCYIGLELQPGWVSTGAIRIVSSDENKFDNAVSADWKSSSSNVCNSNYSNWLRIMINSNWIWIGQKRFRCSSNGPFPFELDPGWFIRLFRHRALPGPMGLPKQPFFPDLQRAIFMTIRCFEKYTNEVANDSTNLNKKRCCRFFISTLLSGLLKSRSYVFNGGSWYLEISS